MLETMRSKAASWVVKILFFFLILSFAVWGVGDMFHGRGVSQTVAEVGDTEIARQDLNDQFRRLMNTMRERFGAGFERQQALQLGLLDQTLEQIINSRLLLLDAREMGLRAGDDLVRTTIRSAPEFQSTAGNFDSLRFREILQREGFGSENAYAELLRQDIVRRQIIGSLTAGIEPPKRMVELLYGYRNEQRVADVVAIPEGDAKSVPDPSAEQLAEFHKKNPALFTAPEYRQVTAAYLDPVETAAEMNPSEQRLREEYEFRKPSLSVPERRELQQALVQEEAAARKISEAVKSGTPFEQAVETMTKAKPVALGKLRKEDLPPALADAVFALERGAVSEPTHTPLGWHVVKVVSIDEGRIPSFEDVKGQIAAEVSRDLAIDALTKRSNQIDDALAGGASLEEAASKAGAKLLTIAAIDARGLAPDGKPVPGLPKDPKFLASIFAAAPNEITTMEETTEGGFFLLRVEKIIPPALKPLDQVREQAVAAWKRSQLHDRARAKAEALRDDAKAAGSLAKAAEKHGLKLVTTKPFTRTARDTSGPLSDALASEMFRIKPGEIALAEDSGEYAVGELKRIIAAEPAKAAEQVKEIGEQLRNVMADDLMQEYLTALRQRYPVEINREAVESIVATGG